MASNGPPKGDNAIIFDLIMYMTHGRTVLGDPIKPYPWLEYTLRSKSDMELKVEAAMTSCTFKTATSCVVGL